jgi:uncharacterized protein (DUF305 family)
VVPDLITGPMRRLVAVVLLLTLAACARTPAPAAFNDVDVMFLQMGLEQAAEGDQVAAIAEQQAKSPEIRTLASELRGHWRDESGTMRAWLVDWHRPLTADPNAGVHAGHGDLHSLRPEDIAELRATPAKSFDLAAVSMLLGNLHNSVETYRMESAGGHYVPAMNLATGMTQSRQAIIQKLLALAA